jgi:3-hydroxy-9,10-secoandrosta-1,3,5(10)-triene-9,17-dione monooxygenase reductase component
MTAAASPATSHLGHSFREALSRFATGVAFVTADADGEPLGLIVNSFSSVSLEPPLISICPSRDSYTWARMRRTGRFAVNVLGAGHEGFVARATEPGADRFAGLEWEPGRDGAPVLTEALAYLECEIVDEHPAGDHWIVVARVEGLGVLAGEDPLIFFAGAFHGAVPLVRHPAPLAAIHRGRR